MLRYYKYHIANPSLPVNLVFEFRNFATALSKQRRLLGGEGTTGDSTPGDGPGQGA